MDTETNSVDDGPSDFMFTFNKTNFSQMESAAVSPVCTVQGLQWQIVIKKHENKKFPSLGQYLGFNLRCNTGVNKYWSCTVRATLTIVTQKRGIPSFFRILQNSFSWLENEWGFSEFMDWHDVLNPERGFIDADRVKFQAHIIANPPKIVNLSLNTRDNVDEDLTNDKTKDDPKKLENMLHLFANEMDENIVQRVSQELKEVAESLGTEQKNNLDGAIKRLKGDLKVYIDSIVLNFREDINSLKNTEKSCPTCCNLFKKENGIDENEIMKNEDRIEIASSNSKPHFVQSMKASLESLNQKMNEVLSLSQNIKPDICYSNSPRVPESYGYMDRISQFSYPDQDLEPDMHCHDEFNSRYSQFECCCAQNYADHENDDFSCIHCQKRQNGRNVEFESQIGFNLNSFKQKSQVEDMSINKALQKEILLIGKDENGQLKTYKPTSAEELSALKQKYQSSEVLEMMKFEI